MPQATRNSQHTPDAPLGVLVVEDHESYRELVCRALEGYIPGVRTWGADTVRSAVALLGECTVNVMVADMTLPDGTALDLLREAQQHVSHGMKVILFSNYSSAELQPLRERADVHAVVTKEQGLRHLAQTVREVAALAAGHPGSQPPQMQAS